MRQGKEISSVKNSIQTRLSGVMLLVLVFALGINVFIFKQIHTAVTRIDAVFSSNTAVNELSESLEQVESTVYEYLNTKSTQALENYYRYEQNYKNLIEELNDRNLDNESVFPAVRLPAPRGCRSPGISAPCPPNTGFFLPGSVFAASPPCNSFLPVSAFPHGGGSLHPPG